MYIVLVLKKFSNNLPSHDPRPGMEFNVENIVNSGKNGEKKY